MVMVLWHSMRANSGYICEKIIFINKINSIYKQDYLFRMMHTTWKAKQHTDIKFKLKTKNLFADLIQLIRLLVTAELDFPIITVFCSLCGLISRSEQRR